MRNSVWSGWPGGAGGGPVTPDDLNTMWPFGQKDFMADRFTLDVRDPAIKTNVQIGTLEKTLPAIKFLPGVQSEAELCWIIKDFQIDAAAPEFKIFPVWYQLVDALDPGDSISMEAYVQVQNLDSSINLSFDTGTSGVKMTQPTGARWVIVSGNAASIENPIIVPATGDALQAAGTNLISIQIERHGDDVVDDYLSPVYLLGISIQYKHDFNNVQEWPTVV